MSGAYDPRLVAYFGDPILQPGFLPVPHLLLRHYAELGLNSNQMMFLMHLMAGTWDLGSPPLNIGQLARRMGVSRRTAQVISAELHERGLIDIFNQFDEGGAQIENGYDLSGLLQRLAVFAPTPTPSGTQRQRRARAQGTSSVAPSVDAAPHPQAAVAGQPHAAPCALPTQFTAPPPCSPVQPAPARSAIPPMQPAAGLKTESKNLQKNQLRNQKEQQRAAEHRNWFSQEEQVEGGRSLRWDTPLSSSEVHQSRQILARIGLNADVADTVAGTLHPAEIWALWLHARIAGLGIPWIAHQVYDTKRRHARMAGIPAPYEEAGRVLAALPPETTFLLLDVMVSHGSHAESIAASRAVLAADPRTAGQDLSAAVEAVWGVLDGATQRGGGRVPASAVRRDVVPAHRLEDARWLIAKTHVATQIATADYGTWIDPLELVHVDDKLIVIGVPNVFVRSEIQRAYAAALQEALELAWGRAMTVEVVIAQALAA